MNVLVLRLEGTLIRVHEDLGNAEDPSEVFLEFSRLDHTLANEISQGFVELRKGAIEFLKQLQVYYEIVVVSDLSSSIVEQIIDYIESEKAN